MSKKDNNSKYPISDSIDAMLKSGSDPVEMINEMKKMILERAMSAELDYHLQTEKHEKSKDGNYRNGYGSKKLLIDNGELGIKTARDRDGSFTLIPKRQRHFKGFDQQILSMY
ncbi:IS256 family transposase domain protein [Candidatus Cyrtobacter comes]|uniref:Mutator family transposase n=1 Tax=Candidatus Cyrtobacter comes TaxID=675776 RepID=A0ABU5L6I8_9RICK|nr:IS256 family transposase domain protein [Candidatus Cyrtobacter comes]